jgi:hypothetical protein
MDVCDIFNSEPVTCFERGEEKEKKTWILQIVGWSKKSRI